jgi:hypothetical protein
MMPPDKAKKTLTNEFVRGMIGNIGADLLVQHTWAYLESLARGEIEEQQPEPQPALVSEGSPMPEQAEKPKKKRTTKKVEKNEPK